MNKQISITKGIAIILMVIGHAQCPDLLHNFIYSFHMPLFFFVSGYLFKDKYLSDPKKFAINKIKGLYIPFVKWGFVFLLLQNAFAYFGLYESPYTIHEIKQKGIELILMTGGTYNVLAGYWFLAALFYVSFWSYALIFLIRYFTDRQTDTVWYLRLDIIVPIICLILCCLFSAFEFKIPKLSAHTLMSIFMFLVGYKFKSINIYKFPLGIAIGGIIICFARIIILPNVIEMGDAKGWEAIPYSLTAIMGIISILYLARIIYEHLPRVSSVIEYIGNATLYILTFHYISFRLVHWFILKYTSIEGNMCEFPVISEASGGSYTLLLELLLR